MGLDDHIQILILYLNQYHLHFFRINIQFGHKLNSQPFMSAGQPFFFFPCSRLWLWCEVQQRPGNLGVSVMGKVGSIQCLNEPSKVLHSTWPNGWKTGRAIDYNIDYNSFALVCSKRGKFPTCKNEDVFQIWCNSGDVLGSAVGKYYKQLLLVSFV